MNAFNINRLTVVAIMTFVVAITAGGQQTCPQSQRRLFGWVRDRETQRPVRDAAITVELGSGRQKLKSDADGHYVICLPPGTYRLLVAKKKPFARHLVTEIRITGDEDKRVDIDLERWRTINPH